MRQEDNAVVFGNEQVVVCSRENWFEKYEGEKRVEEQLDETTCAEILSGVQRQCFLFTQVVFVSEAVTIVTGSRVT